MFTILSNTIDEVINTTLSMFTEQIGGYKPLFPTRPTYKTETKLDFWKNKNSINYQ